MSAVTGVGVSEDGNTLITAGRDQIVSVWNIDDTSSSISSSRSSSSSGTATRAGKKGKPSSSSFPASETVTLIESLPVYEEIEGLVVLTKDETHAMGQGIWQGSEYGGRLTDAEQDALHHSRHTPSSSSSSSNRKRALDSNPTTAATASAAAAAAAAAAAREGAFALAGTKGKVRIYHYKPKPDPFAKGLSIRVVAEQHGPDLYPRGYAGLLKGGRTHPTHLLAITTDHNLQWLRGGSLSRARVLVGYNDQVIAVKYLPQAQGREGGREGGRVVVASNSPQVRVFRLGDLSCECLLEGQHTETVLSLDVSPDGRWVVTGGKDRAVCLWLLEEEDEERREEEGEGGLTAMCVRRYEGHTDAVSAVAMTRRKAGYLHLAAGGAGGTALAFSAGADRTLKRWVLLPPAAKKTTMTRKSRRELSEKEEEEEEGGKEDNVTTTTTTEASASVLGHEKDINALCVAPNDALLASASQDKTVKLWDTKDLTLVGTLKGHKRGVWCVEFSPIDRCVVTGSGDRTVRLWSLTDFSCLRSLEGHGASVLAATFLRNGLQVLSAGADGLMKLWTIRTQECEATMDGHEERVWALAVAPGGPGGGREGGRQAVTGGGDSVLNVWEDVTKEEEEVALLKAEAMVEKEQALQNSVYRKDYFQVWFSSVCHCFFFGSVCFCVLCLHDRIFISSV
jgi:U3 small nucleolar RNA-associated protein 13